MGFKVSREWLGCEFSFKDIQEVVYLTLPYSQVVIKCYIQP